MSFDILTQAQGSRTLSHIPAPLLVGLLRKCVAKKKIESLIAEKCCAQEDIDSTNEAIGATQHTLKAYEHHVALWVDGNQSQRHSTLSVSSSSTASTRASSAAPNVRDSLASNLTQYFHSDWSSASLLTSNSKLGCLLVPAATQSPQSSERSQSKAQPRRLQKRLPPTPGKEANECKVRYMCTCGVTCARRSDLLKHAKRQHTYAGGFQCKTLGCHHVEPSIYNMEQHIATHEPAIRQKPASEERRLVKEDFFLGCVVHGRYFGNLQEFVDHHSADSEVVFIRAFLMQPAAQDQLRKCLSADFAAFDMTQVVNQLAWTPDQTRSIISRNRDQSGLVDLSTSVKYILEKALQTGPLALGSADQPDALVQEAPQLPNTEVAMSHSPTAMESGCLLAPTEARGAFEISPKTFNRVNTVHGVIRGFEGHTANRFQVQFPKPPGATRPFAELAIYNEHQRLPTPVPNQQMWDNGNMNAALVGDQLATSMELDFDDEDFVLYDESPT